MNICSPIIFQKLIKIPIRWNLCSSVNLLNNKQLAIYNIPTSCELFEGSPTSENPYLEVSAVNHLESKSQSTQCSLLSLLNVNMSTTKGRPTPIMSFRFVSISLWTYNTIPCSPYAAKISRWIYIGFLSLTYKNLIKLRSLFYSGNHLFLWCSIRMHSILCSFWLLQKYCVHPWLICTDKFLNVLIDLCLSVSYNVYSLCL